MEPLNQEATKAPETSLTVETSTGPPETMTVTIRLFALARAAARPPLCRADAHLGPADWFGRTLIDVVPENVRIGIVSVAVEGCPITFFDKDQNAPLIANHYPNTYVVSSDGCLPSDDNLHFSSEGYRQLGRHYALRYLEATNPQLAEVCRQKLAAAGLDKGGTVSSKLTVETKRSGETLSVVASEPVEKVDVVSFSGQTVKTFTLNGKMNFELSLKDLPKEKLVFVFQSASGKATTDVDSCP